MNLLTVTNLYPRPDAPRRGMYNAQLFGAVAHLQTRVNNVCLVPEWRVWRWPAIRRWSGGGAVGGTDVPTVYVPVLYLPLIGRGIAHSLYWSSLRREQRCLSIPADAVLSAWLYPDGVAATRLAVQLGVPSWVMVLGSDTFHLDAGHQKAAVLASCDAVRGFICVCKSLADRLVQVGVPPAKVYVVPNGVDTDLFHHRDKREALPELLSMSSMAPPTAETAPALCAATARTVLFVGNLVPVKAPDLALTAFAEYAHSLATGMEGALPPAPGPAGPRRADTRLIFIGEGPMRRRLGRMARALGIEDNVAFLGGRPHAEVARWMNLADCLCLTSRSEGMPNVVIEALAAGLPVVAADVGACGELLDDESAGRVCAPGAVRPFAAALAEMLRGERDREAMSRRHRARRSWGEQAQEIMELVAEQCRPGDRCGTPSSSELSRRSKGLEGIHRRCGGHRDG